MHEEIARFLNEAIPGLKASAKVCKDGDSSVSVTAEHILAVCWELKNSRWEFHVLEVISGVDWPEAIEVNYMLTSFTQKNDLILKVSLPKDGPNSIPEIDSVTSLWASADWQERECYDLIGVKFKGHPGLKKILCPDDWEGHPLRKDYSPQKSYHGIEVNPEDKINTSDHLFCANLKKTAEDPKRVAGSWKLEEEGEGV